MTHTIHLNTPEALEQALHALRVIDLDGSHEITIRKLAKTRTARQNRALHKYCTMLADELNAAGYDVQTVLAKGVAREWDMEAVKALLWKPIQEAMTGKESTAEAERAEYPQVYETVNRHLGEIFGVYVPWPTAETSRANITDRMI